MTFQLLEWPECLIDRGSNLDLKMTDVLDRVTVGHIILKVANNATQINFIQGSMCNE